MRKYANATEWNWKQYNKSRYLTAVVAQTHLVYILATNSLNDSGIHFCLDTERTTLYDCLICSVHEDLLLMHCRHWLWLVEPQYTWFFQ